MHVAIMLTTRQAHYCQFYDIKSEALTCKRLAAKISVLTNLYDNARSANNPYETVLTPAVVASSAFGVLGTYAVVGAVYSQVLIMTNVAFQMPDGTPIRC